MKEYYLFYSITDQIKDRSYPPVEFLGLMFEVRVVSYLSNQECNFYRNPERQMFNLVKTPTQRLGEMIFKNKKVNIDWSFTISKRNESWSIEDFVKYYLKIEYPRIKPLYWIFEI